MPKIYATIGLPASGKSTLAEKRCANGSGLRANRDDIRYKTYGVYFGRPIDEKIVTVLQDAEVAEILEKGLDVWIDDTNLSPVAKIHCQLLAKFHAVDLVWIDLTHVPVQTCIERDAARDRQVGKDVILRMYDKYIRPFPYAGGRS